MRIVYGATCTWWDSIDKVAATDSGLPCCPHCRGVLFESSNDDWEAQTMKHNEKHPGYKEFIAWSRGKCFKKISHAMCQWCMEMIEKV